VKPLISDGYRTQQEALHAAGNYGVASKHYAPLVTEIVNRLQVQHLLDYGCGAMMNLVKCIRPDHKMKYQAYDAGVAKLAGMPVPAELVCCVDVLEHIEPDLLDNVLDHLASLTEVVGFFTVHTGPAVKVLSDGRNAHLIQQPMEWWLPKIMERFELQTAQRTNEHAFHVIVHPKMRLIETPEGGKAA